MWKEQVKSFSAVAIGEYGTLPNVDLKIFDGKDKPVIVDSTKVLMLATSSMEEAYYVAGILNTIN